MATLNERIFELEKTVELLLSKIADLSKNTEDKYSKPSSTVGGIRDRSLIRPVNVKSGFSQIYGGSIPWNSIDAKCPPINAEPAIPTENTSTYHLHSHSRYTGGALIKDVLEFVEYNWGSIINKYAPQHWNRFPEIATMPDSDGKDVEKIGPLEMEFDPDALTWKAGITEIDVEKVYLVRKDLAGKIMLDANGNEMKAVLLYTLADTGTKEGRNENLDKSQVWWDKDSKCWRFYAVFKPMPEE
jgi:hypothetical protein